MSEQEALQSPSIQIDFGTTLEGVRNLDDISTATRKSIAKLREDGHTQIGFVSGPINNSNDPDPKVRYEVMKENMQRMREEASNFRNELIIPIIASTDIFDVVWDELEEAQPHFPVEKRSERMKALFDNLLESGITDVYMIEGWEGSPGAAHERETALRLGINVHDSSQSTE